VADFPEALDDALRDFYSPRGDYVSPVESKRGFQARVRALEKAHGSKRAAAAAAGISKDTWSRWATGKQMPGPGSLAKVGAAHTALLRAAKVAAKGTPGNIEIYATVACVPVGPASRSKKNRYYNGGSSNATGAARTFKADKLTGPQRHDVVTAWAAGHSPQYVADLLRDKITDAYGSKFDFEGHNVSVWIY
jgi:transcriptional regulator with XRE-family HTH domain